MKNGIVFIAILAFAAVFASFGAAKSNQASEPLLSECRWVKFPRRCSNMTSLCTGIRNWECVCGKHLRVAVGSSLLRSWQAKNEAQNFCRIA